MHTLDIRHRLFNSNKVQKKKKKLIKELKAKWKNIKDAYRKKGIHKSDQAANVDKPYVYANILEFLRPTMENRKTGSNVAVAEDDREDNIGIANETSEEINPLADNEISEESLVRTKKKKVNEKNPNSFEDQLITALRERRAPDDPVTSFLMSLDPQIRRITED
ncbi:hypothetical protein QTP88_007799 [Uroleucon formosanum]